MHKLSYKTLFIIFFFLLIGVVVLSRFVLPNKKVSASWWNEMWRYRKSISISNTGGNQSNVYITLITDTSDTTRFQNDCGDIRFTDQTGNLQNYYVVSGCGTSSTSIHINFLSLINGASNFYLYYGNSSAQNGFSSSDFSTAATNSTPTTNSEELSPAPIAYWKFDEGIGTTTMDSSNNFNTGTITGATWTNESECISGKCLNFNGSGSPNIAVPTSNSLNFGTGNFTISAWALNRDYTYPKSNFMIKKSATCFSDGASNSGFDIGHGYKPNGIDICVRDTSNNYIRTTLVFNSGFQPSQLINKWTHYVFIFDRTNNKIIAYINGVKQINELNISSITDSINSSSSLIIGNLYGWQTDGLYDEVKIYPYARTADQIKQDYNSRGSTKGTSVNLGVKSNTAPSLKSSLVAHWRFDEGNGTVVTNSSNVASTLNMIFTSGKFPTWTNNGKVNKALSFSTSQIEFTDYTASPLDTPDGVTFSLWAYPTTLNSGRYLIYKTGAYSLSYGDSVCGAGKFGISINGGATRVWMCSLTARSLNNWYHITGSALPNGKIKIYINGSLENSADFSYATVGVSDSKLTYGDYSGGGYAFSGIIDEPKIYNTALTDEEIKQDYNAGAAIQFGSTNQTIGGTTTSLEYCIPGDTSYCASPVAEWKMDEGVGTSTVDISGNNFTGTISNATWSQGKIGKSLNFNGESSSIYISTQYPSSSPSSFTAEAWIKPNSVSGTGEHSTYGYTIMAASADGSRYPVWITLRNGEIRASAFVGGLAYTETVGANIQTNNWYHIAVSAIQNSVATIYVNGIGKTSFTAGNIGWNTADKLTIADLRPTRNISFNGGIDHVKIYDYARTPAQIAYDYNKGGPIGWWKFDECQGNIAYDWSGIGNTGTIIIGASGSQNSLGTCQVGTSAAWTNGAGGKVNSSLSFDGVDDYATISNNSIFNLANINHSFSLWFKTPNTMTDSPGMIFQRYTGGTPGAGYWIAISSNKIYYENRADGGNHLSITSDNSYNDFSWHHVTITVDISSKIAKMYIDGKYIKSDNYLGNLLDNNANPTFGGQGSNYSFQGKIDDVRIYNYALTSEQVKTVYNGGSVNFQ